MIFEKIDKKMDNFDNAEQPSVTKLYKLTSCDTYQFCHIDVKKCVNVTFEHFVECLGRFDYISVFFGVENWVEMPSNVTIFVFLICHSLWTRP